MTDGRHAPDTLFLVAEGDFRFFREHCVAKRDWLDEVDQFVEEHLQTPTTVEARAMLNPAVPPEQEHISPTTDDEGGGGPSEAESVDFGGAEPDARAEAAQAEPDARQEKEPEQNKKERLSFWGFTQGRRYEGREAYICPEL